MLRIESSSSFFEHYILVEATEPSLKQHLSKELFSDLHIPMKHSDSDVSCFASIQDVALTFKSY